MTDAALCADAFAQALPADFAAFFANEMTRWVRVVKTSGAKAD